MKKNISYTVLGAMSGTSLDGLDLAICSFKKNIKWEFKIKKAITYKYPKYWQKTLQNLHLKNTKKINEINKLFGKYMAEKINLFIKSEKIDFIASHGHTIFHQPEKKITLQIGDGKTISEITKHTTINNFRQLDVSLNGQGAPLVPIGDLKLFPDYKYCLNLGGFANISIKKRNKISAFDICPVNIVLNTLARKSGLEYDKNGNMAKSGELIPILFEKLNKIEFYSRSAPKSLSREWVEIHIIPLILNNKYNNKDILHTFCEHIAFQISSYIKNDSTLISGGGAFNTYLISRIKKLSKTKIIIPNDTIIKFKEAVIFAFLGILKIREEINCLKSVTGAIKDNSGGVIHTI